MHTYNYLLLSIVLHKNKNITHQKQKEIAKIVDTAETEAETEIQILL